MTSYRPTNPSGSATGRPAGQGLTGSEESRFRAGRGGGTYRYQTGKDSVNVFIDGDADGIKLASVSDSVEGYIEFGLDRSGYPIWRPSQYTPGILSLDMSPKKSDKVKIIELRQGGETGFYLSKNGVTVCSVAEITGTEILLAVCMSGTDYYVVTAKENQTTGQAYIGVLCYVPDQDGVVYFDREDIYDPITGYEFIDQDPPIDPRFSMMGTGVWYVGKVTESYIDLGVGIATESYAAPYYRIYFSGGADWQGAIPVYAEDSTETGRPANLGGGGTSPLLVFGGTATAKNGSTWSWGTNGVGNDQRYSISTSGATVNTSELTCSGIGYVKCAVDIEGAKALTLNVPPYLEITTAVNSTTNRNAVASSTNFYTGSPSPAGTYEYPMYLGYGTTLTVTYSNCPSLVGLTFEALLFDKDNATVSYYNTVEVTDVINNSWSTQVYGGVEISQLWTESGTLSDTYSKNGATPSYVSNEFLGIVTYMSKPTPKVAGYAYPGYVNEQLVTFPIQGAGQTTGPITQSMTKNHLVVNGAVVATTVASLSGTMQFSYEFGGTNAFNAETSVTDYVLGVSVYSHTETLTNRYSILGFVPGLFYRSVAYEIVRVKTPSDFKGKRSPLELVIWAYYDANSNRVVMINDIPITEALGPDDADSSILQNISEYHRGVCVSHG